MNAQHIAKGLGKFKSSAGGFVAPCPAHDDKNPSLSISDGEKGKVLVHCHAGCEQQAVVDALKRRNLWPEAEQAEKPKAKARQQKQIVAEYDYVDPATGELCLQVVRYEPKDFRQRRPDGKGGWSWSVPATSRILFNMPAVVQNPGKAVCIVEGEKDVYALASIGVVATCNPGGAGKWQSNYTESLAGRDILILPDNDEPGEKHAQIVAQSLYGQARSIRIIRLPGLAPKGDVADWIAAGGTRDDLIRLRVDVGLYEPDADRGGDVDAVEDFGAGVEDEEDTPFRALGFNNGTYYYLSLGTQQVTGLTPSQHTMANLHSLAPLPYWEREYSSRNGPNYALAAHQMMWMCHARGIFSPEIMRGRGAWYDQGRIVLHMGDIVYVDKTPTSPVKVRSAFVYEQAKPMRADIDNPATNAEANEFLKLVQMMPWASDMEALYVAGWCALAHIGGVLNWRPHIWVVGSKGSGKSHVMSEVIRPILGDNCLFVVSETTEAGIRQSLKHDALPVLFDEAEGEDSRSVDRLQRILALVRQSSSETGGKIAKGTANGNAMSFQVRSPFAFSSINASLVQQSDKSRVTVVELKPERRKHDLDALLAGEATVLTDQFISRFYARSINLAAVIRANALVFAKAVAAVMGEQRAGDQIGTLLAGAYSLTSDSLITFEKATEWVAKHDWAEQKEEVQGQSDERSLLDYLLQQPVRFQTDAHTSDRPIGELVDMVRMSEPGHEFAQRTLGRIGMRYSERGLLVSNTADGIRRLLKGSSWSVNWGKVLRRLPNARPNGVTYFGYSGSDSRAVWVSLDS
jgi:putative DNA primase/helicase